MIFIKLVLLTFFAQTLFSQTSTEITSKLCPDSGKYWSNPRWVLIVNSIGNIGFIDKESILYRGKFLTFWIGAAPNKYTEDCKNGNIWTTAYYEYDPNLRLINPVEVCFFEKNGKMDCNRLSASAWTPLIPGSLEEDCLKKCLELVQNYK